MGLTGGVETHRLSDKFHHIGKKNGIGSARIAYLCFIFVVVVVVVVVVVGVRQFTQSSWGCADSEQCLAVIMT